jgi:RNA polymerase sigma-70 factor (sigma-E family)
VITGEERIEAVPLALDELYVLHHAELIRLAALLLDRSAGCEDVVQEAWVRVHLARFRPADPDALLAYLRQTVVNLARSNLRRRVVAQKHGRHAVPHAPSAEELAYESVERGAVVAAIRALPRRQREAVVLRYYVDLTERDTAAALGISVGAVKAYTSRGLASLGRALEGIR